MSTADIQLVQNLIERCMQMYMPLKEVVQTLQAQAKIEPGFTQLVWQKLEEQNAEFFQVRALLGCQPPPRAASTPHALPFAHGLPACHAA